MNFESIKELSDFIESHGYWVNPENKENEEGIRRLEEFANEILKIPEDERTYCAHCKVLIFFDDDGWNECTEGFLCEDCCESYTEKLTEEAEAFAREHVRITNPNLPVYDPAEHHSPTREQYEAGDRWAHTPDSILAEARHEHTNYDSLLRKKCSNRGTVEANVYYGAIYDRVCEVLEEAGLDV